MRTSLSNERVSQLIMIQSNMKRTSSEEPTSITQEFIHAAGDDDDAALQADEDVMQLVAVADAYD